MKYKIVPEPPADLDFVADAQRAVPLVPGSVEDCCTRVQSRTGLPARDDARKWLTFLEALGLAEETDPGFRRLRVDPDREAMAGDFRERVFGADDLLDALAAAGEPLSTDDAFERFTEEVPRWERDRHPDWRSVWRERVERLLEWAVLLGLAERADGGYRRS